MKKIITIISLISICFTAHAEILHCQSTQLVDTNKDKFFTLRQNMRFVKDNSVFLDLEYKGLGLLNANSLVLKNVSIKDYPGLQNVKLSFNEVDSELYSKEYTAKFPQGVESTNSGLGNPPLTNIRLEFETNSVDGKLSIVFSAGFEDREGLYGNVWFMACHSDTAKYDPNND